MAGGICLVLLGSLIIAASAFPLFGHHLGQRQGARVLLGTAIGLGAITLLAGIVFMLAAP